MGLLDFLGVRRYFGLDQPITRLKHPLATSPDAYGQSGAWKYYSQQTRRPHDRASRYRNYDRMDQYELIASSLDLYAEETFVYDLEHDASMWVDSDNADVVRVAKQLFDRVGMEEIGTGIIRKMIKHGDHFEALTYNSETGDIIHMQAPPPINVARVEEYGKLLGFRPNQQGNKNKTIQKQNKEVKWRPWEIIHFRMPSRERDLLYGDSILYPAATAWEQLKMVEDSLVVFRMTKAADRIIYYVDVGCITGDTKVCLADGRDVPIEKLCEEYTDPKERFSVHSYDVKTRKPVVGKAYYPRCTGEKAIYEIILDNGTSVECTANHPFLMRNGTYKRADALRPGEGLMPYWISTRYVVDVIKKNKKVKVYDLSVDDYHNFALSNGIYVHNSATPEEAYDIVNRWRKAIKKREHLNKPAGDYRTQWNPTCFRGDTRIMLIDGTSPTFEELAKTPNKKFWVYARNKEGKIVPGLGHSARLTGIKETCLVTLDNGYVAECTLDHPWMLNDGTYRAAGNLKEGDSLAAAYFRKSSKKRGDYIDGYEQLFEDDKWIYTHHKVVKESLGGYRGRGKVAHHADFNKLNNAPENLQLMSNKEHLKVHGENWEKTLGKWMADPDNMKQMKERARKHITAYNKSDAHRKAAAKVGKIWGPINTTKYNKSEKHRKVASETLRKVVTEKWKDPEFRAMLRPHQVKNGKLHAAVYNKSEKSRAIGKIMAEKNFALYRKWQKLPREFKKENPYHEWKLTQKPPNHCVVSVVASGKETPVYDITVDDYHNFLIDVRVENSGDVRDQKVTECSGITVHNSIDHDMFWAVREGSQSRVEKLPGTPNISDIVDVEYQRNKVFGALRIPRGYMGFEESQGALTSESTLSSQSVRFASTIKAIRKAFLTGIRRLVAIQLVYKGIDPEDPKNAFKVGMAPISYLDELMRSKTYQLRMDMVQTAMNVGMQAPEIIDQKRWLTHAFRLFLRLSDDDIQMFLGNMPDIEGQGQVSAPDADKLVQLVQSTPEKSRKSLMEAYLIGKLRARACETYPDRWEQNPLPPMNERVR